MTTEPENILFGFLFEDNQEPIPVKIAFASNASLHVKILIGRKFTKGHTFSNLNLLFPESSIDLGNCQLLPGYELPNFNGKLVFTDTVYDFHILFERGILSDARTSFDGIGMMLDQKVNVKDFFKHYVNDLSYDIHVYKKFFDDLDLKYKDEQSDVKGSIQKTLIATEGRKFLAFFDRKLDELKQLVANFSKEEHELHGYYLRLQLRDIISSSCFLERVNAKPRGYAGDSEMMSMIYNNEYYGETIFQKLMHKHPLESDGARSVRNRKNLLAGHIFKTEQELQLTKNNFRLMSIACGPAAELENILLTPDICRRFSITLLDQDVDALNEASENLKAIESRMNEKISHKIILESVRTMTGVPGPAAAWGKYHFIYSMGLFDYLNDKTATAVLKRIFELLEPGGVMLIGNYSKRAGTSVYMKYWMDWPLLYRSEEELLNLASAIHGGKELLQEETGSQIFLKISKFSTL